MTGSYAVAADPESSPPERDVDLPRLREVAARVPVLTHKSFVCSLLPGGLTNRNYRVRADDGQLMVVRLSSAQSTMLTISRDDEYANALAAAAVGVAPAVLAYLPEFSALVIEWIVGRTFGAADLDDSVTLNRVAATCRQLHGGPRFASDFDMFALARRYLDQVLAGGFRLPADYVSFMPAVTTIRGAMSVRTEASVPCHNDLLPANIMADENQLWFIDYEYAGNGEPSFELGNLCSEAQLGSDRLTELVTAYYGAHSPGKVARARLQGLMSNYGWTLWACIQAATSELDFDFWSWGLSKYERAVAEFRGPELSSLIAEVQQP